MPVQNPPQMYRDMRGVYGVQAYARITPMMPHQQPGQNDISMYIVSFTGWSSTAGACRLSHAAGASPCMSGVASLMLAILTAPVHVQCYAYSN